jgi:serine/threonine-protein phosphatase 2A regulatory subunit B
MKGNIGLGDELPAEADTITAVQFSDEEGEFLATGDLGGRIVIFKRNQGSKSNGAQSKYGLYSTFQSHEREFDYLKSIEIEEKINQIKWLKRKSASNFLLSTNDKTVKLWKISERDRKVADGNYNLGYIKGAVKRTSSKLVLPRIESMKTIIEVSPRRVYANAHTYHINSISVNPNQETFISADDLRINLWHHEITSEVFTIVDLKPTNMDQLTEVISCAEFHPKMDALFAYGSSNGVARICDTRLNSTSDIPAKTLDAPNDMRGFFSEILSSLSDVKFSPNGKYLLTRDYLNCYVWDLAMERKPVETYNVHDHLQSNLCSLYKSEDIFDKFEACWSGDDRKVLAGSYSNSFHTFDRYSTSESIFEAGNYGHLDRKQRKEMDPDKMKFEKKIMHCAYHPTNDLIALAASNNLFLYIGDRN